MYYYHEKHYPFSYSFHRPDGTQIAYLQSSEAFEFEKVLEGLDAVIFPSGCFRNKEQLLSAIIDQYDVA